jgi:tetratricopeptide (TPR) repeat protein
MLGRELCALGRFEEAEPLARRGRELGEPLDATCQGLWRQVQALVLADRGEHAQAERLAREAVAIMDQTDGLNFQAAALCDLAEVLDAAGRRAEAARALDGALDRYERKGNIPMARHVRARLSSREGQSDR